MQTRTRGKLVAHLATFGTVPVLNPHQVLEHIFESNLDGRGGVSYFTSTSAIGTRILHTQPTT